MWKYGVSILLSIFVLCGCAGTVHRENNALKSDFALDSVAEVEIRMTDEAQKLQTNNTQFSTKDLLGYLERKLDGQSLLKSDSSYRLQVTITRFRIRSALSAVMWGIMAGTDSVDGTVQVLNRDGKPVHSFDVSASYGLGGWGGGQDGTRMNWLYGKFAELTIAELTGKTEATNVKREKQDAGQPRVVRARQQDEGNALVATAREGSTTKLTGTSKTERPAAARAGAKHNFTVPEDSSFAPLGNADAIPYVNQRAKESYALYLTRPNPRVYVIAAGGAWAYRIGKDALSNALAVCESKSKGTCYPYAIDDHVVWQSDDLAREAMRKKMLEEILASQNAGTTIQKVQAPPAEK
ncbi:DUF4410 domain-containing protein [Herbaspirillum lusitanum]|uniref:DUF4410 domain-containing protein n=1 Tax=Herbaspirillum lusitanum TaxID=213312 RepID=A0ABW9A4P4_9BURK